MGWEFAVVNLGDYRHELKDLPSCRMAEEAAALYHREHSGRIGWPLTFRLWGPDGVCRGDFLVERDPSPEFHATKKE